LPPKPAGKPEAPPPESVEIPRPPALVRDLSVQLFTVSAGMAGVCFTVTGILQVVINAPNHDTLADDFRAVDSVRFLLCCILSDWSLRTRSLRRMHRVERMTNSIFITAPLCMVITAGFITYNITTR